MHFSVITVLFGVLAGNVIAGPVASPDGSVLDARARRPVASQGQPCSGVLEGSPISGTCGANGLCGVDGAVSNEFVQFRSDDC
ncbi:hypothetical protein F5X68DRAFT_263810 [Plectosphaerella plurivora]|uniref:Uncharacterized protein n=1 Tax=Plectosphaerella plurivora TaxID=936078 RepID=A0A9P8V650_9PEZI|nr:hypothetical protein F5X68DRAFT_263810 [Plectosphaerella plurivora]